MRASKRKTERIDDERIVGAIRRCGPLTTTQLCTIFGFSNHSVVGKLRQVSGIVADRHPKFGNVWRIA